VRENAQTNNLPYSELKKDASRYGVGMPEYLLLFRKPHTTTAEGGQWSDARIDSITDESYGLPRWQLDANSFWRSSGERQLMPWEQGGYDYKTHVAYLEDLDRKILLGRAHGQPLPVDSDWVWWDIQRIKVLNGKVAKESEDEKHIAPLTARFDRALHYALVEPRRCGAWIIFPVSECGLASNPDGSQGAGHRT
jgi:hypothetical protein